MHLAGAEQKSRVFRLQRLDGGTIDTALRYSATRALCASAAASAAAVEAARDIDRVGLAAIRP